MIILLYRTLYTNIFFWYLIFIHPSIHSFIHIGLVPCHSCVLRKSNSGSPWRPSILLQQSPFACIIQDLTRDLSLSTVAQSVYHNVAFTAHGYDVDVINTTTFIAIRSNLDRDSGESTALTADRENVHTLHPRESPTGPTQL